MSSEVESAKFHGELTVPKPSMTKDANTSDAKNNAPVEPDATPEKTPTKRKATPKKAAKKEEDGDEPEEPITPKPTKKRTPKPKKEKEVKSEAKVDSEGGNAAAAAAGEGSAATTPPGAQSSKKRGAKAKATNDETETPTKKRKTKAAANGDAETPVKTRANANAKVKFPESFEDFSEGDKLLVRMRKEGDSWEEIARAWTAVTGQIPGKDVLRKKETKLRALAIEWKAGDARKLALFKNQIEEENAAALKKLDADKWNKMVEMFKAAGSIYSSPGLQKKWEVMQKKGEVDAKGNYVVDDDVEAPEAAAEGTEASGDAETNVKDNGDVETDVQENGDVENEDVGEDNVADNEEA